MENTENKFNDKLKPLLKSIEEENNLANISIIDQLFAYIRPHYCYQGSSIYYKLYLTSDTLYIYSFDSECNLKSSRKLPLEKICSAGALSVYDDNGQEIKLDDSTIFFNGHEGCNKDDLIRFMKSLESLGVKNSLSDKKIPWLAIVPLSILIIYVIFLILQLFKL